LTFLAAFRQETLNFCFEWKKPDKKGAKFSTNQWPAFETSIRSYIDVSKTIKRNEIQEGNSVGRLGLILPFSLKIRCLLLFAASVISGALL